MILRLSNHDQFVKSRWLSHLQHAKDAEGCSERCSLNLCHLDVETWLVGFDLQVGGLKSSFSYVKMLSIGGSLELPGRSFLVVYNSSARLMKEEGR